MNKSQKTNLIVLGVVFVILLMMKKRSSLPNEETKTDEVIEQSVNEDKDKAIKKEPYLYDWKQIGDKDEVVKLIQKRIHMILKLSIKWIETNNDVIHSSWIYRIWNLYKNNPDNFKIDGIFGKKTQQAVYVITGKNGTSLDVVRRKYLDIKQILY